MNNKKSNQARNQKRFQKFTYVVVIKDSYRIADHKLAARNLIKANPGSFQRRFTTRRKAEVYCANRSNKKKQKFEDAVWRYVPINSRLFRDTFLKSSPSKGAKQSIGQSL